MKRFTKDDEQRMWAVTKAIEFMSSRTVPDLKVARESLQATTTYIYEFISNKPWKDEPEKISQRGLH